MGFDVAGNLVYLPEEFDFFDVSLDIYRFAYQ